MKPEITNGDITLVSQCLDFLTKGKDIEDPEFETRVGASALVAQEKIALWQYTNARDRTTLVIAINCFNEVLNGIRTDWSYMESEYRFTQRQVEEVLRKVELELANTKQ